MSDLFGQPEPTVLYGRTGHRYKTGPRGGKASTTPRGYGGCPGTGPAGQTCGTCKNARRMRSGKKMWIKCELARAKWTGGRGTDILARTPACDKFEAVQS